MCVCVYKFIRCTEDEADKITNCLGQNEVCLKELGAYCACMIKEEEEEEVRKKVKEETLVGLNQNKRLMILVVDLSVNEIDVPS